MANFLIVGDLPISADALEHCVRQLVRDASFIRSTSLEAASQVLRTQSNLDLVIFDLWLPSVDDLGGIVSCCRTSTKIPFIVMSSFIDTSLLRAAEQHQVASLLSKANGRASLSQEIKALLVGGDCLAGTRSGEDIDQNPFMNGLSLLTRHERLVLKFIVLGLLNKQIAHQLGIQEATVKAHIRSIFRKLRVHSRVQALLEVSMLNLASLLSESDVDDGRTLEESIGSRSH